MLNTYRHNLGGSDGSSSGVVVMYDNKFFMKIFKNYFSCFLNELLCIFNDIVMIYRDVQSFVIQALIISVFHLLR